MTSGELKRWLADRGCTFSPGRGGHLTVRLGKKGFNPANPCQKKDLGTRLVNAIKKQLGLK